ncbi:hypothetical protein Gpo141_00004698 [Globisporangium polare]
MQNKSSTCGYDLSSQVGYLFERQRAAMRQNSFARARSNVVTKRKNRESDSSDEELFQQPPNKKKLLEGLKRMRVSSPPSSHSTTTTSSSSNTNVSDSSMTDSAMNDDDDDDAAQANAKALVPLSRPRRVNACGFSTKWSPTGMYSGVSSDLTMPAPTDPFCRAIVPFGSTARSFIPRGPIPRIELVESDEEQNAAARRHRSDEEEEPFVRFEEIHEDEDEPMEID